MRDQKRLVWTARRKRSAGDRIQEFTCTYKELPPNVALRPHIRCYFHLRVSQKRFQLPADGCPCLMISLGDPFELGFENGKLEVVSGCLIVGLSTRWSFTRHGGQTHLVAVKFLPGRLSNFFRVPAIELINTSMGIEALWGKSGRELEQRLGGQGSVPEITRLLDEFLLSRFSSLSCTPGARIPTILNLISSRKGRIHVEDIASRFGLSPRQLERLFADSVGLSPKRMCRITRFKSAVSSVANHQGRDWAELAYTHGYSDQAHLIRECKFFTGHSPVSYLKHRSSLVHSVMCTVDSIPD